MVYKILDNHNIRFSQIKCDQPSFPRCDFLWNYKNTSDCVLLMITTVKCSQLEISVSGSSHPLKSMNIQTRRTQSQIRVCNNTQASNKTKRDSTESYRKSWIHWFAFIYSLADEDLKKSKSGIVRKKVIKLRDRNVDIICSILTIDVQNH